MFLTEEVAWYDAIKRSGQRSLVLACGNNDGFACGFKQRSSVRIAQPATPLLTVEAAPNPHGGDPQP